MMWKKAVSTLVVAGIFLAGCANNGAAPRNDGTPVENMRDHAEQWENNVERDLENHRPDRDDDQDMTGSNQNDHNRNDDEAGDLNHNPQVETIEDLNRKNDVQ